MCRALVLLFLAVAPAAAQFRPTDGIVLTRAEQGALLDRVVDAYRNLPDDLTFVNDEPRLEPMVRAMNGLWYVVEMTVDGQPLPARRFDGLTYEFDYGAFRFIDSPVRRPLPPSAIVEFRTPEVESVYTNVRELAAQESRGQLRDFEAIRPRMLYVGEGRARIWWWDRFGESLDPVNLYRDPGSLTSIPDHQAIPTEGSLVLTATQLRLDVRGVGLRSLLPPKFQGPLGADRSVVLVLERQRRDPGGPPIPLTTPPAPERQRLAAKGRPAPETAVVRHTLIPDPKRIVFDPPPSPTRIVFLPEKPTAVPVVRNK
ncbi:MAG TPA: hypothetical protein VM597_14325 [Gemmataceae bacterium]|nr:hypothetical protein [Gemmataceae bacterium]